MDRRNRLRSASSSFGGLTFLASLFIGLALGKGLNFADIRVDELIIAIAQFFTVAIESVATLF